jgi:competence protein ComEA
MFKKFVAALAALLATTAFAAVEANKATQAELEAISGIGPTISATIVSERKKAEFKDWNDLFKRVRGVGDRSAAKFSQGGLTVAGKPYPGAPYVEPVKSSSSTAKAASGATRAGEASKANAAKSASAGKSGGEKSPSGTKGGTKAETRSTAASAPKK